MTDAKAARRAPFAQGALPTALSAALFTALFVLAMPTGALARQSETPEAARARLNAEQAAAARAQNERNAASQAAYEAAVRARAAEIARIEAETARQKAEYDATMKQWQADVAACNAGDYSRCAKPGQ